MNEAPDLNELAKRQLELSRLISAPRALYRVALDS